MSYTHHVTDWLAHPRSAGFDPVTDFMASLKREPWMSEAACAQADPDAWFRANDSARQAVRLCHTVCRVRQECLAYATAEDLEGIWGGTTDNQRGVTR